MRKQSGQIGWIGHHVVKVAYIGDEMIPIEEVMQDVNNWKPCKGHIPTGKYDTDLVMHPATFEPMRYYRVKMIDPNCPDVCCCGSHSIKVTIEA